MSTSWYVVKVLPGKERQLTEQFNQQISIGRINNVIRFLCPTEKEFVIVKNKKVLREKVIYSGYLYFESKNKLNEDDLKSIALIPNIMGMMGDKTPKLMNGSDVKRILKDETLDEHIETKRLKFAIGESIIVKEGAFSSFEGSVSQIHGEKVDVDILIFGRKTPVTLSIDQIKKI
jgi:transcriptional antiterminator NusG